MYRAIRFVVLFVAVGLLLSLVLGRDSPGGSAPTKVTIVPLSMVALVNASSPVDDLYAGQFCGGTLVSPTTIVTAWHCVKESRPSSIDAVVGARSLCRGDKIGGERRRVVRIERPNPNVDMAMLHFLGAVGAEPVRMSQVLPSVGDTLIAWGWGVVSLGLSGCAVSRVDLRVTSFALCAEFLDNPSGMEETGFCAAPIGVDQRNTCNGDSGGPVFRVEESNYVLVGVTLAGGSCASDASGYYGGGALYWGLPGDGGVSPTARPTL